MLSRCPGWRMGGFLLEAAHSPGCFVQVQKKQAEAEDRSRCHVDSEHSGKAFLNHRFCRKVEPLPFPAVEGACSHWLCRDICRCCSWERCSKHRVPIGRKFPSVHRKDRPQIGNEFQSP